MARNRTLKEEWGKKCCNNCQYGKIENEFYDNYYCKFTCEKHTYYSDNSHIRGFLDCHYCRDFSEK